MAAKEQSELVVPPKLQLPPPSLFFSFSSSFWGSTNHHVGFANQLARPPDLTVSIFLALGHICKIFNNMSLLLCSSVFFLKIYFIYYFVAMNICLHAHL